MIREIKRLSLAFVAAAAMSIAAASIAQATEYHIETPNSAILKGEQTTQLVSTFTNGGATAKCTQALFEGTVSNEGQSQQQTTTTEFTLTPTVTGCKVFGQVATLKFNGCKFTVTTKSAQGVTTPQTAYVDIVGCTVGKQIEVETPVACTITAPEQSHISHAIGINTAEAPKHIEVQLTLQGISYEYHGEGCGGTQTTLTQNGDLAGKITLKAYQDSGSEQATHNGHQYNKLVTGAQVGFFGTQE